jgi:signal transduction histidine kinase
VIRRRSLTVRLLLLSVTAVVLPAILISAIYRSISSRALLESIEQNQTELARRIAEEVNNEVQQARSLVALVAKSSFFSAGSRVDQYEALRNLLAASPAFQETMLTNAAGVELLKVSHTNTSPRLVKRSENLSQSYVGLPFFSGNRAPTILLAEPIRSFANPRRSGAILAKMSFTQLGALMKQATVGPRGVAYIVDSKGTLLAYPDDQLVLAHTNWSSRPVVREWSERPDRATGLTHYVDERGEEHLSLAFPIPLLNSAVVIQQPEADVYAPLKHMRRQFILWTLVSVLVFLLIAIGVSWRILQPLRQLQVAVEDVGQGKREIHLDIHTHDELEDLAVTFEKMTRSLAELERVRRDLISMIVHDLKMPLATILPSLESLLAGDMGRLSKDQSHFVQMARRSSHEMLMLIENLLDVAKMEEGKLTLHRERFAPADWAKSVIANFQPLAEAAKKKLTLTLSKDLAPVEGDAALLGRVLGNLISNALRHTPAASGEVSVSLYRDGSQLAVEVRDNGEGIPQEEQERIFDKFVQGEGQTMTLRSGTGLGLTFCKMVVEAHGGHITLFSQPKEGSVFTFRLALKEVPAMTPPPIKNPLAPHRVGEGVADSQATG